MSGNLATPAAADAGALLTQADFYARAELLAAEFERHLSAGNHGAGPFATESSEDAYRFEAAQSAQIYTRGLLTDLLAALHGWAYNAVGALHVSTPRAVAFLRGCRREVLRDDVSRGWHYLLPLSAAPEPARRLRLMVDDLSEETDGGPTIRLGRLVNVELRFNQLVVHKAGAAYGIEPAREGRAAEALFFLDGFLW